MNKLLIEAIDSAIQESGSPIVIKNTSNLGKIKTYLRDKYNPVAVDLSEARTGDLFITEFYDKKTYPRWYVNLCTLYMQNQNKENILILDSLEEADLSITAQILSEIVLDEEHNYLLPENASIILIANSEMSREQKQLLEQYNDYLTHINDEDPENIYITFGENKKGKTK